MYEEANPQKHWYNIVTSCKEALAESLGCKKKSVKHDNDDVRKLFEEKKQIKLDINATDKKIQKSRTTKENK